MIYDYKSEETVQDVILECYCPLVEDIADEFSTLRRYENLSIYAPSYVAREILACMLDEIEDVWVHAESENELLYKDENEVVITIGHDGMIFVESARGEGGQLKDNDDCSLTYIYDGFGKKDIDVLSASGESILIFGFEEEEIENDDMELSTTSTATYLVNDKEVDKDTYEKSVAEFDKKFREIIDEMNTFRRLFW